MNLSEFRLLGRGGFSTVYVAHQAGLGRAVAVKVLPLDPARPEDWARFQRECKISGQLSDRAGVVPVYEAAQAAGGLGYIVMAFMEGGSLADLIRSRGPVNEAQAVHVGRAVARTLDAAHEEGILHRDIKPANLLISRAGDIRLGDFGIATLSASSTHSSTTKAYTPAHVAPEILRGLGASPQSDVYSLASTMYELVQGASPFRTTGDEPIATMLTRKLLEPPPVPTAITDEALRALVIRALDPDPTLRPSASEFADALEAFPAAPLFAPGQPVQALDLGPIVPDPITISSSAISLGTEGIVAAVLPIQPDEAPTLHRQTIVRQAPVAEAPPVERGRRKALIGVSIAAALLIGGVGAIAVLGGDGDSTSAAGATTTVAVLSSAAAALVPGDTTANGDPALSEVAPDSTLILDGSAVTTGSALQPPNQVPGSSGSGGGAAVPAAGATPTSATQGADPGATLPESTTATTARTAPGQTTTTVKPAAAPATTGTAAPGPTGTPAPTATQAPTSTQAPVAKPVVGTLSVTTSSSGVKATAAGGDRCASSSWTLSGPVSKSQSSTVPAGCFSTAHAFDSTWYQLTLTPGTYSISLTLTNAGGSATSSSSFTISAPPTTTLPAKPIVGSLSVATSATGVRASAPDGDRCASSSWTLSGPVSKSQSSAVPAGCFSTAHAFDSTWYQLTLTPGDYSLSLTLTNAGGSTTSSSSFTITG